MERLELDAQTRTVRGKKVKRLRAQDWIPAVVYGPDTPSTPIQVERRPLSWTLRQAGSTTLINLSVDDESKPYVVLAREIQRDILTGWLEHVDFYQVRLTELVKTTPRLDLVGESLLVESGQAVLIQNMNEVEVECLPTDLINAIEVDLSALESMDDSILIGDLPVPSGVTILADPDEVVASLVPPRVIEEEEVEILPEEEAEFEEEAEDEDEDED
jgi:large subunit ribosomal protein L25